MINRKEVLHNLEELLNICDGCLLFQYFKQEKGRRYAHKFCIHQCTIGEQLKNTGKKLMKCK